MRAPTRGNRKDPFADGDALSIDRVPVSTLAVRKSGSAWRIESNSHLSGWENKPEKGKLVPERGGACSLTVGLLSII